MASSNIKLFDENKGNMLTDAEFSISNQRLNGLQTGVASSLLQNKAMYQASLVAYAIAQVMMQNGLNANDTDAVSTFVANLSGTMLQKVYDLATKAEAQAGVATGKWMSPALVKAAIDALAAKAQNVLSDATKGLFGLSSDAVPDDVFTKIARRLSESDGLSIKLLWENAAPNSSFGRGTVQISNITIYDIVMAEFKDNGGITISNTTGFVISSGFTSTVVGFNVFARMRTFTKSDDGVYFGPAYKYENNRETEDNSQLVPIRIYGIKGATDNV